MKYIVYLTTNINNNKIYIGVHKTKDPSKFDGYIGNSINIFECNPELNNPKLPFHKAVKKYGYSSFRRSIIKEFDTLTEALDLEAEIVNEEFLKRNDVYNVTLGGGLPPLQNKIIYQYSLDGIFIKQWDSIVDAATYLNSSTTSISRAVSFGRTAHNYLWSDKKFDRLDLSLFHIYSPNIIVYIYNSDGSYFKTFESLNQCAKYLNTYLSHIQRAIKLGTMVQGYYISTELVSVYQKPKTNRLSGLVHQYDLSGNYIQSFNSIKEVEKKYNESFRGINESIRLNRQYKGYIWFRGEFKPDKLNPITIKTSKKVGQYTKDGQLIKIFDTVTACRKEFPNASKVLNGSAKYCHGFYFKYIK